MDTTPSKLRFTGGTIHFIYSFLLNPYPDPNQFDESTHDPLRGGSPLDRLESQLSGKGWQRSKPNERIGVTTNLDIDGERKSLFFKGKTNGKFHLVPYVNGDSVKDKDNGPISLSLDMLIRINDNGSSTFTLSVKFMTTGSSLSAIDVHKIFNLVPINNETKPLYALKNPKGGGKTLFSYFLEQLGCHVISKLTDEREVTDKHAIWLDTVAVPSCNNKEASDWQNPFTIAQLVLDERYEAGKAIWTGPSTEAEGADADILRKKEELFTLYTRMLKGIDAIEDDKGILVPRKLLENGENGLRSFSWHDDVFIGFHGRGRIVIRYRNSSEAAIAKELTESYLDLMEILRARWHLCVVFGEVLLKDLNDLRRLPTESLREFTKTLLMRRGTYIYFLSDPTMYAFEGGVVSEICRFARSAYGIDDLSKLVSDKFQALDNYYRERVDLALAYKKWKA